MLLKLFTASLFISALMAQTPSAPQALTVVSATAKQVQLKWTAGDNLATGYIVERKPLGGSYTTAVTVATTAVTATDSNIDAYTTYVYRVRGTRAPANPSDPSNEVTVGPAPYGYNLAAPIPAGFDINFQAYFGAEVRMTLDSNGDPALAYTFNNPSLSGDFSDSALYFVRWDRAHYQWTSPVKVAVIGEVERFNLTPISIAQDASNGAFGIAYQDESNPAASRISLALSTDSGQTWKTEKVAADNPAGQTFGFQRPSLSMAAGNVYLAFFHEFDGIRYVTGKQSDDPSKWTSMLVPLPGVFTDYGRVSALALDSTGKPGIAYVAAGDNGEGEAFWRPGGAAVLIGDNQGQQNDFPDIRLTFFGTQPRVVFDGAMDDNFFADDDHGLWVMVSPDTGTTWSRPVNVRSDGNRSLTGPIDLTSGSRGQLTIVTESNSGNLDASLCGNPKLAMASDPNLANWTTCGPAALASSNFDANAPNVKFAGNDTLYIGFEQTDIDDGALPLGITVWRQPPGWTFPPPAAPQE